jgi:hypothetical protein
MVIPSRSAVCFMLFNVQKFFSEKILYFLLQFFLLFVQGSNEEGRTTFFDIEDDCFRHLICAAPFGVINLYHIT